MNKPRLHIFFALILLVLAGLACNFGASTANIENAWTARDKEGAQPATVFAQDEVIHLVVELANAPDDTVVKASWTAVDVEGEAPNTALDESELTSGDGKLYFELSNDLLWPVGQYKVDVYLNDELDSTLEFEVQGDVSPPPAEPTSPPPVSEAVIEDAFMARDGDGAEPTTVFGLNDIFYCIVYVANGPDDTNVKAIWYGAETEGGEPTTQLDEVNTNQGSGSITFNLSNQEAWMPGAYRVEIYLNGVLDRTLDFEVQADVPPASGAVIEDAFMSRDEAGTQPTTLFGQNDVFYCIVTLANAPQDTNVRAAWTAVNVQGEAPNTFIDEADITQGDGVLTFNLSNNQAWPIGLYKVDLYLNGELVGTIEFEVQ